MSLLMHYDNSIDSILPCSLYLLIKFLMTSAAVITLIKKKKTTL